jgi:hypothetical protein
MLGGEQLKRSVRMAGTRMEGRQACKEESGRRGGVEAYTNDPAMRVEVLDLPTFSHFASPSSIHNCQHRFPHKDSGVGVGGWVGVHKAPFLPAGMQKRPRGILERG